MGLAVAPPSAGTFSNGPSATQPYDFSFLPRELDIREEHGLAAPSSAAEEEVSVLDVVVVERLREEALSGLPTIPEDLRLDVIRVAGAVTVEDGVAGGPGLGDRLGNISRSAAAVAPVDAGSVSFAPAGRVTGKVEEATVTLVALAK